MGRGVTPSPTSHPQTPGTARSPWTRALASQPGFRVVGYRVSQGLPPSPGMIWGVERMGVLVCDPPVSLHDRGRGNSVPLWITTCIFQSFHTLVHRPVGGYPQTQVQAQRHFPMTTKMGQSIHASRLSRRSPSGLGGGWLGGVIDLG